VNRPGSKEAGGSGVAAAGGAGRALKLEPVLSASMPAPKTEDDDGAALPFALVESDTKLLAPIDRGMVNEVE